MPPTKDMGVIKQNRRGRPTKTPLSTSGYLGVDLIGRVRVRQHRLMGCIFLAKFGRQGGFDTIAKLRWADRIGPSITAEKINHTTINRRGPLYGRRFGRGTERRPCLWQRNLGRIFDAWGGLKAWPIGDRRSISMCLTTITP